MRKSKPSQKAPKIADAWDMSGLEFGSQEKEIMGRFDLYGDGDWKQAILAAIVALENDLPLPDWAVKEVMTELCRAIKCEPLPPKRPVGRASPPRQYIDKMNRLAAVAAVDAAIELGLHGEQKFQAAEGALNREGVIYSSPGSVDATHKKCRNELRKHAGYPVLLTLFIEAINERPDQ